MHSPNFRAAKWYGASWKLAAFVCYAALNAISKLLSTQLNPLPVCTIVLFQDLFALVCLSPWLVQQIREPGLLQQWPWHLLRGASAALGVMCWNLTLTYMQLADAVALRIMGPIFGVIAAKWVLKERLGGWRGFTLIATISLSVYLLRPEQAFLLNQTNNVGLGLIILTCLLFTAADITSRLLAKRGESASKLTNLLLPLVIPIVLVPALFNWVTPTDTQWLWLGLGGIITAASIYCISQAFIYAEVSFLALFSFCQVLLNGALGYFAFKETPAPWTLWLLLAFIGLSFIKKPN